MRMPGYCEKCHRVRPVQVSMRSIAQGRARMPIGICADCEQKEAAR